MTYKSKLLLCVIQQKFLRVNTFIMFFFKFVFFISIWRSAPATPLISNGISQADSRREETVYSCEGSVLDLSCRDGLVIKIIRANYGRLSRDVCDYDKNNVEAWSGKDCMADSTYYVLDDRCEQKQRCSIRSSNSVFGDPCSGTIKYLEVQYDCVPPDSSIPKTEYSCQGSELHLSCEKGRVLNIIKANYGRLAGDVCDYDKNNINEWTEKYCMAENSYSIVNDRCGGKQSCAVKSSDSVFGDPCRGTIKYLEVQYSCEQRESSENEVEGCPGGWNDFYGDYCFFTDTENKLTWQRAHFECMRRGGTLASLHSEEESRKLHELVKNPKNGENGVHIGFFRILGNENVFIWADGSDVDYQNWNAYEPSNVNEKCVEALTSSMKWNDLYCDSPRGYICSALKGNAFVLP